MAKTGESTGTTSGSAASPFRLPTYGGRHDQHRRERQRASRCRADRIVSGELADNVVSLQTHRETEQWVEQLRAGHPRRDQTVAKLHELLLRVAFHELSRRSEQMRSISGPEFDDLAHQAADDALVKVLAKLHE